MMISTVPNRIKIEQNRNLIEWLKDIQQNHGSIIQNSLVNLNQIYKWIGVSSATKLFNTSFVYENIVKVDQETEEFDSQFQAQEEGKNGNFNEFDTQLV